MQSLIADLRYAIRLLARAPGFTIAVIVVLALGIGANSAIFTALDRTVIRPLPYMDPDRLVTIWEDFTAFGTPKTRVSPATFFDWRKRSQFFDQIGGYLVRSADLSGGGAPEQVLGIAVTSNLLPLLGVSPLLGRTYESREEGPESRLVILSYGLWQRRYAGDRNLLGQSILMNGEKYSVIGIMPAVFHFPDRQTEFWWPLGLQPQVLTRRNSHFMKVVARLKPGHDWRQAQADMDSVARQLAREYPASNSRIGVRVVPLKEEVLGDSGKILVILLSAAACVLLIACANVANLLLARASGRQREIAVRIALGARPSRLLRQILTENLLLACTGGVLGLLCARWSMAALQKFVPAGLAGSVSIEVNLRVVAFAAIVSIATGLLFGLAPALQLTKSELSESRAGRGTVGQAGKKLRDALVVSEVAIALMLVVGAALLIETLVRLRAVNPGFRSAGILTADVATPLPKYANAAKRERFYSDVLDHLRALPGVQSAGLTSDLPYTSRGNTMSLSIEGQQKRADLGQDALFRLVSAGYLETIGARLKEGRYLSAADRADAPPAVVVNETLARQFWPGESALGHRIDTGTGQANSRWMSIVGVVADIRERGLDLETKPAVYVPLTQTEISFFLPSEIAVLTSREPLSLSKELQQAVWAVDSEQPVANIRSMETIVDDELAGRTQVLQLLGAFAALALLLAALGIYSVLSYVVARRSREIGLRMAIGATRGDIVRIMLGYTAKLTAAGLGIGVVMAMLATRLLSTLLYGVSPLDPAAFCTVGALLAVIALLASYLPARRAAALDPAITLREE